MSPDDERGLLDLVASTLARSPFAAPARWGIAVVVLRVEERRVTSRGDFAGWLAANDLPAAARECIARKVPSGSILVWIDIDTAEVAGAGFRVFDLASALRRSPT